MNFLDWTNLGGLPFTQNRMQFLQDSNLAAFSAIARLCGDYSILYGIEVNAGNVSSGWFALNGELVEFIGGSVGVKVKISETSAAFTYANNVINNVQFTRTATCGPVGDFDFSLLIPLLSLQNVWSTGDIREKYIDPAAYPAWRAANFDGNGFGINKEKGWRLLTKALPATAGRTMVTLDPNDAQFDLPGKVAGAQTHKLAPGEQGSIKAKGKIEDIGGGGGPVVMAEITLNSVVITRNGGPDQSTDGTEQTIRLNNDATPFDKLQPSYTIIKLIKL